MKAFTLVKFTLTCKKCGSTDVIVKDETCAAGDGGGHVDRWGEV